MHIIVTTPSALSHEACLEAEDIKQWGGGSYLRKVGNKPQKLEIGDRCYYTERGYIRGYAIVSDIVERPPSVCDSTGKPLDGGWYVEMDGKSWRWVKPYPYKGFQGFRYFGADDFLEDCGDWLAPMPKVDGPKIVPVERTTGWTLNGGEETPAEKRIPPVVVPKPGSGTARYVSGGWGY